MIPLMNRAQNPGSGTGQVEIIQDPRVEILVSKHIQINQNSRGVEGFRIQIFSESGNNSKSQAQTVLDEFVQKFSKVNAYLTFKSPNYRIRIGDFRTRLDAKRFLLEIATDYSNAFIISDQINLPRDE